MIARLAKEWCVDNGIDPAAIDRKNIGNGIITDSRCVDSGRVKALRKAGWKVFDIAVDCHCTEDCVKEILNEV